MQDTKRAQKKPSTTKRTLQFYGAVTATQLPLFLLSVASTLTFVFCLSFGNPFFIGKIVDRLAADPVAADQVFTVFGPLMLLLIGTNILGQVASKLQDYSVAKLEIRASYALATRAFDTLSDQSMTFHSNRFGGSLVSQTQKFISAYSLLMESFVYAALPIAGSAVFIVVMLIGPAPLYVAVLCCLLVVYVFVAYRLYKKILPLNAETAAAQNALSGELSDSISNILTVKTYGREAFERDLFDKANRDVQATDSRRMRASILRGAITSFMIVLIMAVVILFVTGGNAWFGISAGTLVMMFTYTYSLTMQFNRISQVFQQINRAFGDAHDMTCILDEPKLVADSVHATELAVPRGDIAFEHVGFWYLDGGKKTDVFRDFTLEIPAGQRVGLVGRSGAGKTTLTKLLLRLSDLPEGHIVIDGQNIAEVTQTSLRRQIAYVPQEPLLFHRSIRENISYGKPSATDEEIREAATKANALEFIERLPLGFDTVTGERGVKLSGGQRQRIAIARAILAEAPILVLDEATSALDSESEKLIQDALKNLMQGRTSLVVAHRLSTVASLDRIIVMGGGHIIEDGTHEELLAKGGE
ncbi:MAG: ABC transporter ATP-binding protein, partial [Raoultibacter sp.]